MYLAVSFPKDIKLFIVLNYWLIYLFIEINFVQITAAQACNFIFWQIENK